MSGKFIEAKESLVDKILEQGQKLRNSMIQSILQHDPLNCDILSNNNNNNKLYNTPVCSATSLIDKKLEDKTLLEAFLNGDYLTKEQEELALNTVRTIPSSDVCKLAENTIFKNCTCSTCTAYNENSLKCDLRRNNNEFCCRNSNKLINNNEQCINLKFILQQVDSLKVILHTINLNNLGCKKVIHNNNNNSQQLKNETYFIEYVIPDIFIKNPKINKSKVDSGLNKTDRAKICAKSSNDVVSLKHTFIHSISNLSNKKLEDYNLIFTIRYKEGLIQKKTLLLGIATFNFSQFTISKNLSCSKTLSIFLDKDSAISVGTLKVILQLGAGKIYFGQEFINAVLSKKESSDSESFEDISDDNEQTINLKSNLEVHKDKNNPILKKKPIPSLEKKVPSHSKPIHKDKTAGEQTQSSTVEEKVPIVQIHQEDLLLFGFFYVSEAQFVDFSTTSYLSCQLFCQNDSSLSKLEYNSSNPLYNFCQIVPLVYNESLLLKFRENFMILEFWEKSCHSDELFGVTRIPLHQFYLGYRNSIILKHLKANSLPIIGTDWWEPIYSVDQNQLIGQVQILSALGTQEQIRNLEIERGFKDNIVKSKFPQAVENIQRNKPPSSYYTDKGKVNRKPSKPIISKKLSAVHFPTEQIKETTENKVDIGTQSELIAKKMDKSEVTTPSVQMQDTLVSFLKLLENRQKPSCVESSTNTECASKLESSYIPQTSSESVEVATGPQMRKTSDLLDSLQKALNTNSRVVSKKSEKSHSFKVEIAINSANQLPCRRKIRSKSKKSKGKAHNNKQDENILPSTYVTFETTPEKSVHITKVYPKSSSPKYDFKKYVQLPLSYLNDGNKRLIFKVWRKSTNTVLQPNMQSDLVLGFAALDLSVLAVGMPNIQGWFNIVDFSGKCNGQINIHVNPMEKLPTQRYTNTEEIFKAENEEITTIVEDDPNCNELLSRALKRKFTELDEITRRLRLRLSEVVSENSESDGNDDITEEFESDINSICVEEDFDLVNFEEETTDKINEEIEPDIIKSKCSSVEIINEAVGPTVEEQNDANNAEIDNNALLIENKVNTISSSEASMFNEQHLNEGKHRIDALLQKLTLISADINKPFEINRYVSGCSAVSNNNDEQKPDMQDIFRNLEQQSRPNITASNSFDPTVFDQLYGENSKTQNGSSEETSVITTFSDDRSKPDGQGDHSSEEDAKN